MTRNTNNFNETAFNEIECLSKSMGSFLSLILDDLGNSDEELANKIYGLLALNSSIIHQCDNVHRSIYK